MKQASRKIKPTPERVERMLEGERDRLARLDAEMAECRAAIATLEAQKRRLEQPEPSSGERKPLKRVKIESSKYEMRDGDTTVAIVVRTGEYSRDDYPWDWYLADGWTIARPRRAQGNSDVMRDCVETVQIAWREGWIIKQGAQ